MNTQPDPKHFGYIENEGFDSEPSGWAYEGGEEAYLQALKQWEQSQVAPVAPIDKTLSAERFIEKCTGEPEPYRINIRNHSLLTLMEAYGDLRVEQAKDEWEKEKEAYAVDQVAKTIQAMSNKKY